MNQIHKVAAVAVTSAVAVASLALPSAAATRPAPATTDPAAAAAGYLARALVGPHHDHYVGSYVSGGKTITYANYGETADAILSMDAAGVAQSAARRATRYLEKNVKSYAGSSHASFAPGPIGKLLLVAEAQHVDTRSFGGLNLVAALSGTEGARHAARGEYQQNPAGTPAAYDYSATVSQALGVLALADLPHSAKPDAAAVKFLAAQRCKDGGYPTEMLANAKKACAAGEDIDSTGYAVQALIAAGSRHAALKSLRFLLHAERGNGGFGDKGSAPNANSTALAIQALIVGGDSVTKPERWLAGQQVRCGGAPARRGAVRFQTGFDSSALLATSQAGAALAGKSLSMIDSAGATGASPVLSCPRS